MEKATYDEMLKLNTTINNMVEDDMSLYGIVNDMIDEYNKDRTLVLDTIKKVMVFNEKLIKDNEDLRTQNDQYKLFVCGHLSDDNESKSDNELIKRVIIFNDKLVKDNNTLRDKLMLDNDKNDQDS